MDLQVNGAFIYFEIPIFGGIPITQTTVSFFLVTVLLCFPINAIIQHLTGILGLKAILPWEVAAILVVISVVLTSFAGVIPAKSAAKKDPVVALRTE